MFEERDLFSVLEDWGYEVCPFDPGELSLSELKEVLALQEAAAEPLRSPEGPTAPCCSPLLPSGTPQNGRRT